MYIHPKKKKTLPKPKPAKAIPSPNILIMAFDNLEEGRKKTTR
jgi:hypothetical protein